MTDLERTLKIAEGQRERLAATLRVFIFLALLAAVLSLREHGAHHHPVLNVTIAYGVVAVAGLVLAWREIFHPLLPFLFVTLEVVLVAAQTVLMGALMGQPPMSLAALPISAVIFVILAHAAMRYRPWLVVYAAGLFLTILTFAGVWMPQQSGVSAGFPNAEANIVHHQLFPTIMIVLSAGILFVTARGTQQLLFAAISDRIARYSLSRFFATDIAHRLVDYSSENEAGGTVQPVAILFADIRGFSPLAEELTPVELTELLGEFRAILARIIRDHDGVVDKFIGDAAMAVFGFPEPNRSSPEKCLECAYAMLHRLETWSEERVRNRKPPVNIGIGMHYGDAFVGVVGREELLEFTVIGDTVNIAERLERLSRSLEADIVVSRAFAEAANLSAGTFGWKMALGQLIAGHSQPLDVQHFRRGDT